MFPITLKERSSGLGPNGRSLESGKKKGSFDVCDESTGVKPGQKWAGDYSTTTTQVAISEKTKEDDNDLNLSFDEDFFLEIQRRGGIELDD